MNLLTGNIIGIVDASGVVHSQYIENCADECHEYTWVNSFVRWRWNHQRSIFATCFSHKPNPEQMESIRNHMSKKYSLTWYENGHHNIEDLMKRYIDKD